MTIMSQRCCGNCEHFQKGKGGCPGRCVHPERRTKSDLPVFVRKHELPCRFSWDQDLWQPVLQLDEATVKVSDVIVWTSIPSDLAFDEFPDDLLDMLVYLADDETVDVRDWLAGD
jgi:hypothetical protein